MHHRRNVSGGEAVDHRYKVCVLTVMCNMSPTTWMGVVVLAFQHRLSQRISLNVFSHCQKSSSHTPRSSQGHSRKGMAHIRTNHKL
jgi:hypothetical protein